MTIKIGNAGNHMSFEIKHYVNCDDLCNHEDDMFPRRSILAGEWYSYIYYGALTAK